MSFIAILLSFLTAWAAGSPSSTTVAQAQEPPAPAAIAAPAPRPQPEDCDRLIRKGHALYFRGEYAKAISAYEAALRVSSAAVSAWINGAAVLDETGDSKRAARWYEAATRLDASDDDVLAALGWAQLRSGAAPAAAATFRRVLQRQPDQPSALLGLARSEMASAQPRQAVSLLTRVAGASPFATLTGFFLGRAYEALDDSQDAVTAYRRSIGSDAYFLEGRQALGRAYLRMRSFNEAYRQFNRILDSEPRNAEIVSLVARLQPMLARSEHPVHSAPLHQALSSVADSPAFPPKVPVLRIGIGTTPMGHPRARLSFNFSATSDFTMADAKTGKVFATDKADSSWTARVKKSGKKPAIELSCGTRRILRRGAFVITPKSKDRGLVALNFNDTAAPALASEKLLRGQVEVSVRRRTLSVVNRLDLENYTHGVVSAEMPVRSPIEALKAQAVVARTHALYIKSVTRRHRKDGYDVCDEQHCQVYAGARAESPRSRDVVDATRGVIVTYQGKPAHVIYSSNCGGRTQNGGDVTGWGSVPYWRSVSDAPTTLSSPDSPWAMRRWVETLPETYCRPSGFVHPSIFRWSRIIPWPELSRKVDRRLRTGKLKRLTILRRSPSGNVNAIMFEGARRRVKVDSELTIRGLLGTGSLRSTLFVPTIEFGSDGKPEALVLQGGGWGHAVGLCQSGAMGRADAGQNFEKIILSYFPGTKLGKSAYVLDSEHD